MRDKVGCGGTDCGVAYVWATVGVGIDVGFIPYVEVATLGSGVGPYVGVGIVVGVVPYVEVGTLGFGVGPYVEVGMLLRRDGGALGGAVG